MTFMPGNLPDCLKLTLQVNMHLFFHKDAGFFNFGDIFLLGVGV